MDSDSISSKRSSFYYRSLVFLSLLLIIGLIFVGIFFYGIISDGYSEDFLLLMFGGYIIIALSIYGIYLQFTKAPAFIITQKNLVVKNKKYAIDDITTISFSGKKNYGGLDRIEGMKITFKENKILYVYDRYYTNIAEIKRYLSKIRQSTKDIDLEPAIIKPLTHNQAIHDHFYFQKGGIISFNILLVVAMLIFFFYIVLTIPHKKGSEIALIPFLLFIIFLSRRFYYFGLGEHLIVVKNFAYPWLKKQYSIHQVNEILFESNGKAPHSMTIIMKDYTTTKYSATTLYDKHWRNLKHELIAKGVAVRDELHLG